MSSGGYTNEELASLSTKQKTKENLKRVAIAASSNIKFWASFGLIIGIIMVIFFHVMLVIQWVDGYILSYGLMHFSFIPLIFALLYSFMMTILVSGVSPRPILRIILIIISFVGLIAIISHGIYAIKGFFTYSTCSKIASGEIIITNTTAITSALGAGPHYAMCYVPTFVRFNISNIGVYMLMFIELLSIVLAVYIALVVESGITARFLKISNEIGSGMGVDSKQNIYYNMTTEQRGSHIRSILNENNVDHIHLLRTDQQLMEEFGLKDRK